jgi:PKD repeat protein
VADGTYTVTLIVTDGWGKSASTTRSITITEPPTNLPPVPVISNPVCVARTCNFFSASSTDPNGDTFTYLWSFGDTPATTSTSASPAKTYLVDATYTVSLTLTDSWGDFATITRAVIIAEPVTNVPPVPVIGTPSCVARLCSMSSAGSADPNGDAFTYLWNFGDGTATSTASAPPHTFPANGPYTVTLTLTDAWGDAALTTRVVSFTEPPTNVAPVPVIDPHVCAARTCTFSAVGSTDPNGDTFTYLWNFGDTPATTSTSTTPTKTYLADASYTVTLTLTDSWGRAASTTRAVVIAEPASNLAPIAVISAPVCNGRVCTIPGISSSDPNGDVITYLWNFGDTPATSSTVASPSKTFTVDGSYTVTLTVTDAWGDVGTTTRVVTIAEPVTNLAPVPVINAPSCAARVCAFSGVGSSDPNGDAFTYLWSWGDGTATSTGAAPSHTFAGVLTSITVTLTVTDGWGDAASTTRVVTLT